VAKKSSLSLIPHTLQSLTEPKLPRYIKRNISGVLLLDKPLHIASNKALQIAKRLYCAAKAGHTGTLDPLATGLLPLCLGEATKFSGMLLGADKTYTATMRLGYSSSTGDAEGDITPVGKMMFTRQQTEAVMQNMLGKISQLPPMYSALKHQGKPLYAYAREGVEIERKQREVTIYSLELEAFTAEELQITVKCSSGTYVRTLAEDLGIALGCGGAYLTALRRTAIGEFNLSESKTAAHTLADLEAYPQPQRDALLLPVDALLQDYPIVTLDERGTGLMLQGREVSRDAKCALPILPLGSKVRLYAAKQGFLGLGELTEAGVAPKRLLVE